jgi:rhodanese-related sulfurtransferase
MTESSERPLEAPTRGSFRHLNAAEAWDLVFERQRLGAEDLALFDVRNEAAFKASHLEGAVHLAESDLPGVLASLPRRTTVVVYCHHGRASQTFATTFSDFGFSDVYSVDGGFEALRAEHDERAPKGQVDSKLPQPEVPYGPGDMVFSRRALYNDGGMPDCAPDALIAPAGARGVIVKLGRAEAAPEQALYVVRFEDAEGVLGPPVGCLPEELTQKQRQPSG